MMVNHQRPASAAEGYLTCKTYYVYAAYVSIHPVFLPSYSFPAGKQAVTPEKNAVCDYY